MLAWGTPCPQALGLGKGWWRSTLSHKKWEDQSEWGDLPWACTPQLCPGHPHPAQVPLQQFFRVLDPTVLSAEGEEDPEELEGRFCACRWADLIFIILIYTVTTWSRCLLYVMYIVYIRVVHKFFCL